MPKQRRSRTHFHPHNTNTDPSCLQSLHCRNNAQNVETGILSVSCQTHLMMPNSSIQSCVKKNKTCCIYMSVCVCAFQIPSHPASTSDKNTTATEPAKTCKRHFTACSTNFFSYLEFFRRYTEQ